MSHTALQSLFAQKAWANTELFNLLATLGSDQHAEALDAARRTLNHIYVVDRIFRAHLLGEQHGYTATNTDATPELGELQFAVAETDAWYENHAATISADSLRERIAFRFTDGDTGTMTREEMLLHAATCAASPTPLPRRQRAKPLTRQ